MKVTLPIIIGSLYLSESKIKINVKWNSCWKTSVRRENSPDETFGANTKSRDVVSDKLTYLSDKIPKTSEQHNTPEAKDISTIGCPDFLSFHYAIHKLLKIYDFWRQVNICLLSWMSIAGITNSLTFLPVQISNTLITSFLLLVSFCYR